MEVQGECQPFWQDIFRQTLYVIVSTFAVSVNLIIITAVIRNKKLHKKNFILLGGLAVGHMFDGGSYLAAGSVRLRLITTCSETFNVTRFYCMQAPANSLVIIGESISAWMILFLSVDRIAAVCTPNLINEMNQKQYSYGILAFTFICASIDCTAAWIISYYDRDAMVLSLCTFAYSVPNWFYTLHKTHMIICGYLSIFIYVGVMSSLIYRRRTKISHDSIKMLRMKREWKVTKTLSIIILMTFAFQIVPVTLYISELKNLAFLQYSGSYVWTVYCANDAWDMLFYAWKMTDLRDALKETMGCCKKKVRVGDAFKNGINVIELN